MQGGKFSLAWNSVYLALDDEAAQSFTKLVGPHAAPPGRHTSSGHSSKLNQLFHGCFCGAPPGTIMVRLEILDAVSGKWNSRDVPQNLSAIMIENLPKRWANGDDFWELDSAKVRLPATWSMHLLCGV